MKALRIKLRQNQASYTREETVNNRMTYPLPPFSTIIGALHNACGYKTYHPMEISVQGRYGAMQSEVYTNHALLNSTLDDRGTLIWLPNSNMLSTGYIPVAEAVNGTGNSFEKKITIREYHSKLLEQYIGLKALDRAFKTRESTEIKPKESAWKEEKKLLKAQAKTLEKGSEEALAIKEKIDNGDKHIQALKATFKEEYESSYKEPYSHFKTLTKGPQHQEVLYEVELVLHVRAEESVLNDIMSHQHDFIALGRSEDFVELEEMKLVTLAEEIDEVLKLPPRYTMAVNMDRIEKGVYILYLAGDKEKQNAEGTVYYISKDYTIMDGQRVFNRIPCLYTSNIFIDEESEGILWDSDGNYIVDFN